MNHTTTPQLVDILMLADDEDDLFHLFDDDAPRVGVRNENERETLDDLLNAVSVSPQESGQKKKSRRPGGGRKLGWRKPADQLKARAKRVYTLEQKQRKLQNRKDARLKRIAEEAELDENGGANVMSGAVTVDYLAVPTPEKVN